MKNQSPVDGGHVCAAKIGGEKINSRLKTVSKGKEKIMKNVAFLVVAVVLALSGITLAQQSGEEKKGSSMKDMMQEMMKGGKEGEQMGGMMQMMKMMEQCSKMMESAHESQETKQTQK